MEICFIFSIALLGINFNMNLKSLTHIVLDTYKPLPFYSLPIGANFWGENGVVFYKKTGDKEIQVWNTKQKIKMGKPNVLVWLKEFTL